MSFEPQSFCSSEEEHKTIQRMLEGTSRNCLVILPFRSQAIMSGDNLKDVCLTLKFSMSNVNLSCCNLSSSAFSIDQEDKKGILPFLFEAVFMYLNAINMFLFCLCLKTLKNPSNPVFSKKSWFLNPLDFFFPVFPVGPL